MVTAALPGGGHGLFVVEPGRRAAHGYRTFDGQRGADVVWTTPRPNRSARAGTPQAIDAAVLSFQSALCAEAVGAMDEILPRLTTDYPQDPQTVRRSTQDLSDADPARGRHVRLTGTCRSMATTWPCRWPTAGSTRWSAPAPSLQIGRSGRRRQESIQLHGGIGVTAEYPIALRRQLTAIDQTFGSSTDQLRYLVSQVGTYGTAELPVHSIRPARIRRTQHEQRSRQLLHGAGRRTATQLVLLVFAVGDENVLQRQQRSDRREDRGWFRGRPPVCPLIHSARSIFWKVPELSPNGIGRFPDPDVLDRVAVALRDGNRHPGIEGPPRN